MFSEFGTVMNMGPLAAIIILIIAVWSIMWKGIALWVAANEGKKWWFIPILIFNTAGILEIVYLFFFSTTGKDFLKNVKKKRKHREGKNHTAESEDDTK